MPLLPWFTSEQPVIQSRRGGLAIPCFHFFQKFRHFIQFRNFATAEPHQAEPNHRQRGHNDQHQCEARDAMGHEIEPDGRPISRGKRRAKREPSNCQVNASLDSPDLSQHPDWAIRPFQRSSVSLRVPLFFS